MVLAEYKNLDPRKGTRSISAHLTDSADGSSGGLGAHGRSHIDAGFPVGGFDHQGHRVGAATTEDESAYRNTFYVFPFLIERRTLGSRCGETSVGMGCVSAAIRGPLLTGPVDEFGRSFFSHTFPPDIAIGGESHIGEDAVLRQGFHGIGVGLVGSTGSDAKIAVFRVDSIELAVLTGLDRSG